MAVTNAPQSAASGITTALVLAPAAGCLLLPSRTQKWLCLVSAAAALLEQSIPTYDATLFSWQAPACLTANIARASFASQLPEIRGSRILRFLASPWTLAGSYMLRVSTGCSAPEVIATGASAFGVAIHAGKGIKSCGAAALSGDLGAIATCGTHIANAAFSAFAVASAWNGHQFIYFWKEPSTRPGEATGVEMLEDLKGEHERRNFEIKTCRNFLGSLVYGPQFDLRHPWYSSWDRQTDYVDSLLSGVDFPDLKRSVRDGIVSGEYGSSRTRLNENAHKNLETLCFELHKDYVQWTSSPRYNIKYNSGMIRRDAIRQIYERNLPGTEISETFRHWFVESQPDLEDLFTKEELDFLKKFKLDELPDRIKGSKEEVEKQLKEHGLQKYVGRIVRWVEETWYPAWKEMDGRWRVADLPRKQEFEEWIGSIRKPVDFFSRLGNPPYKTGIKESPYKTFTEEYGAITADILFRTRLADYQAWIRHLEIIEKDFPQDKVRQFMGQEKSLHEWQGVPWKCEMFKHDDRASTPLQDLWNDIRKKLRPSNCPWEVKWIIDYKDHRSKNMFRDYFRTFPYFALEDFAVEGRASYLNATWSEEFESWSGSEEYRQRKYAEFLLTPEQRDQIKKDEQRKREEEYAQDVAKQFKRWTEKPLKEMFQGMSNEDIGLKVKNIFAENAKLIWDHLTEKEKKVLHCAGYCTKALSTSTHFQPPTWCYEENEDETLKKDASGKSIFKSCLSYAD